MTEIGLVNPDIEPVPYWRLTEEEQQRLGYDLMACIEYNDAPFKYTDILRTTTLVEGDREGPDWEWFIELKDGRRYYGTGGCDYTGWDCQSGATFVLVATRTEWGSVGVEVAA